MKRALLAAPAMALIMAVSTPAIATDGYECDIPNGVDNALDRCEVDKALNILISANTNQGNGNGGEALFGTIFHPCDTENRVILCGIFTGLPGTDTDITLGDGKDPGLSCFGSQEDPFVCWFKASDPGNSADTDN